MTKCPVGAPIPLTNARPKIKLSLFHLTRPTREKCANSKLLRVFFHYYFYFFVRFREKNPSREDVCRRCGHLFPADIALFMQESDVHFALIFQCDLPTLTD